MNHKENVISQIQTLLNLLPMKRVDRAYRIKFEALLNDRLSVPVHVDTTPVDDLYHIDGTVEYPDESVQFHIDVMEKQAE